ncbi:MAG: ABC transporter permease [Oscillospiraceae bacterium]|nr:ABC transporter permease [Oscillospiraceae bacterium]
MIAKLAWKNLFLNPVMYVLMIVQMVVIYFIVISMTSSVLSRFSYYLPFKEELKKDGTFYSFFYAADPDTGLVGTTTDALSEKLKGDPTIAASYLAWLYYPEQKGERDPIFVSMDEFWLTVYQPEMENGHWFNELSRNAAAIPIVVSQNEEGISVGDIIELRAFGTEQSVNCEVIGILKEGARILSYQIPSDGKTSCKNLYQNYYYTVEQTPLFILPQPALDTNVVNTQLHGSFMISYPENASEQIKEENHAYLTKMTAHCKITFPDLYRNSMNYIFEQCKTLSPILIAVLIMTLVCTMSVNALSVKRQLYHYAVYYICGLRWKHCVFINLLTSLYISAFSLLLTIILLIGSQQTVFLQESVISLGIWQIMLCLLMMLIYLGFSIVLPIQLLQGITPNTILRSN